ncbi:MAG: biotin transporter BioY, partial [Chloroflexi bacterium]|nr:biotin transporter BioY [Chloroflexota bacterium]
MAIAATLNQTKYAVFRWRYELSIPKKIALAVGVAGAVGLLAQARLPLPWSPVPITGQTFGVLLAALFLGRWWGGVSLAIYAT